MNNKRRIHLYGWTVALLSLVELLAPTGAWSQSVPVRPKFEVASIKPSPGPCVETPALNRSVPGRLFLPCISLLRLVGMAYSQFDGLKYSSRGLRVLGGPDWVETAHYEIVAKPEGTAHIAEMAGPMLQVLLEERFRLRVHKEPRDTAVYELTVMDTRPKLSPLPSKACAPFDLDALVAGPGEAKPDAPRQCPSFRTDTGGPGEPMVADCYGVTMAEFAGRTLRSFVDRPVIDRTGLNGRFEIHLEAMANPEPLSMAFMTANGIIAPPSSQSPPEVGAGPSVFEALKKIGLKLAPTRAPIDVIVIDYADRPSAN